MQGTEVELVPYDTNGVPLRDASGAVALFRWWLSTERGDQLIDEYPLRWIHSGSAGVDHILTDAFRNRSITLTNSSGVHAPSIAEWVVLTMLFFEKDLGTMLRQQRERVWEKVERPELSTRTVGIIGAGAIATEIAKRLKSFGPRLLSIRRSAKEHPLFDEVIPVAQLKEAASRVDWLIVAVPLSAETRHLVDRDVLASMKPEGRIINVARGEIVEEPALIEALRDRRIGGAIIDVVESEPPAGDHPFWDLPNVLLLPHTTWRSPEVKTRQLELFVDNLQRFVRGDSLRNVVDVARGY